MVQEEVKLGIQVVRYCGRPQTDMIAVGLEWSVFLNTPDMLFANRERRGIFVCLLS